MIRVNLLRASLLNKNVSTEIEVEATSEEKAIQRQKVLTRVVIMLGFPMLLYFVEVFTLPAKRQALNAKQSEYTELANFNAQADTKKAEIVTGQEQLKKDIAKNDLLKGIVQKRTVLIRVFENIQEVIPQRLWTVSISLSEKRLLLKGFSVSDLEISQFMESLSKNALFIEVSLVSSVERGTADSSVREFEISCILEI